MSGNTAAKMTYSRGSFPKKKLHAEEVLGNGRDFSHLAFCRRVDHLDGILSGTDSVRKVQLRAWLITP